MTSASEDLTFNFYLILINLSNSHIWLMATALDITHLDYSLIHMDVFGETFRSLDLFSSRAWLDNGNRK